MKIRRSEERGHANHGWLDSFHSFSFADYYDPENMGFGTLRVINEDWIDAGQGFGKHPHRDMEIITYVLEGELRHSDSMGTGSVIRPGDVQRMSAGTGVFHSEFNNSSTDRLHLLQIWILPEERGIKPGYEEKKFSDLDKLNKLKLVASKDARDGSVRVHQDIDLYASVLESGKEVTHENRAGRLTYIHVARGAVSVNGEHVKAGDAVTFDDATQARITTEKKSEFLVFDLNR